VVLVAHQVQRDCSRLLRREVLLGQGDQLSVNARAEHVAGLDVQVRRTAIHRRLDDLLHSQYPARLSTTFPRRWPLEYRLQLSRNRASWRGQTRPGETGEICGLTITWRRPHSLLSAGSGSCRKTSNTAPRIRPSEMRSARATSSSWAPRATLTT